MAKKTSDILNIDNVSPTYARSAGGKFAGLVTAKPLIDKYVAKYNVPLAIPQTYGIKIDMPHTHAFDAAMRAMDACGGNVAVRSSADIEDASGKTYSGAFESVLNVDNKDKMKDALDVVYGSAKNVPGAKMGIVIQRMITNPDIAGVVYSQDFNGDLMTVINYTHGRPADWLLTNRERGDLSKISKYHWGRKGNFKMFSFPDIDSKDYDSCSRYVFDKLLGMLPLASIKEYGATKVYRLAALGNHLEYDLGYPVDVEFAVEHNETINILQQRPYVINSNYVVRQMQNGDFIGYNKTEPIIRGTVKIVDIVATPEQIERDCQDKILLSKDQFACGGNDGFFILALADSYKNVLHSKLKIDATYRIQSELYGHRGNQFREHATPFLSTKRAADFANVNDGDMMEMDMRTGMFKIMSQKIR